MVEMRVGGEEMHVLPERAVWWPRRKTVCIADMHLGKAAAYRSAGVPVPEAGTIADLERLGRVLDRLSAERLVVLGDMLHASAQRGGRSPETMMAFALWRARRRALDILLVRGNHDVSAGDPPAEWGVRVVGGVGGVDEAYQDEEDGAVVFAHDPEVAGAFLRSDECECGGRVVLCGHIHPAVSLMGAARSIRARCVWARRDGVVVLPAFGSFTGSKVVMPHAEDRVVVIGEGEVVEVGGSGGGGRKES